MPTIEDEKEIDIADSYRLLAEFAELPQLIRYTTYLGICKYPGNRFEEVCSRILAFFFDPNQEHGFNDLFLKSLLECLTLNQQYQQPRVKVELEHPCPYTGDDGMETVKRLDIIIHCDTFIIGIENKINAEVNNPLNVYKHKLNKLNTNNTAIVLSLRKINNPNKVNEAKFIPMQYSFFLDRIKQNLGQYINASNNYYLHMINDFINTMETMENSSINNPSRYRFFLKNKEAISKLKIDYENFNRDVLEVQLIKFNAICELLNKTNSDSKWKVYDEESTMNDNTLYEWFHLEDKYRIGLEAMLEATYDSPIGKLVLYIVAWREGETSHKETWEKYKTKIKTSFAEIDDVKDNDGKMIARIHEFIDKPDEYMVPIIMKYEERFKKALFL